MQTSIERSSERRNNASPRVPVDLLVELRGAEERAASGADDAYDADALDVSASGLRMRSAFLPDVGQRLKCRFELPEQSGTLEAEGEVVWSSDEGSHQGEFGLRFDMLGKKTAAALSNWATERGPTTLSGDKEPIKSDPLGPAKVAFLGVASAMDCDVVARDEARLEVMQALPFFELGRLADVTADGSTDRRRLEHVSLRIDQGIPHLVLSFVAEASSAGEVLAPSLDEQELAASSADRTLQDEALGELLEARAETVRKAPSKASPTPRESAREREAAVVEQQPEADDSYEALERATAARRRAKRALFQDESEGGRLEVATERKRKLDEVRRVLLDGDELPESESDAAGEDGPESESGLAEWRARGAAIRDRIGPAFTRAVTALRAGWAAFVAAAGPRSHAAWSAIAGWVSRLAKTVSEFFRERAPKLASMLGGAKEKRRTTHAPVAQREPTAPRRATRGANGEVALRSEAAARASAPESARPRIPLRYVLLGTVALLTVGALAYTFGSSGETEAPIVVPAIEQEMPAQELGALPPAAAATATPPSIPTAPVAPPAPAALAITAPSEPSAMAAPSMEEGRLALPGYPSIDQATSAAARGASATATSATSASLEQDSRPIPAPVVGRSFGAASVEEGRVTTLQMSLPPSGLEGQADPSGFTVTIRGALSETRAAQIARTNPSVDRASVINRGDHCVLDVRFVEGRSPAYRVEIRNQTVDVTIGR